MRNRTIKSAAFFLALAVCASRAAGGAAGSGPPPAGKKGASSTRPAHADLRDPGSFRAMAPATFKATFETSKGKFVVEAVRDWAPLGVDRFYNLVRSGFFEDVRFFRVIPNFLVQFGIHGDPAISQAWLNARLPDEPNRQSNRRGTLTYVKADLPNSRTTQFFIHLRDNTSLDSQGFVPFARVIQGMEVVEALNSKYAEGLTDLQGKIYKEGNAFLTTRAPDLDYIKKATITP
jgi:peptidyl-prolyl cis-trans isomerase A (cyclophilin A)